MTTQTERTKALVSNLPTFMQLDINSNNYKFLNSFSPELNVSEIAISSLKSGLQINTAKGKDLEKIGKLFKLSRNTGELDPSLRGRIKAFFQTAIKSGSEIGLKESLVNSLDIKLENITLVTVKENIFDLDIELNSNTNTSIFNAIRSIVNKGKAAGVRFRNLTTSSAGGIFLTDISYVDGEDYII